MLYITVRVVDSSGRPEANAKVSVWRGGWVPEQRTDSEGESEFAINATPSDRIRIYAKGQIVFEGYPKAHITVEVR